MITLKIETQLNPTEDREKITHLFKKFYPFNEIKISKPNEEQVRFVSANAEGHSSLEYLFNQARAQQTVEAIRRQILSKIDLNHQSVSFFVHKQALMNNRLVLCVKEDESPLGPFIVTISANNIEQTVNYLFPPTKDGKVLEVDYTPN